MSQMSTADKYIELMGLPPPKDQQCHEFDTNKLINDINDGAYSEIFSLVFKRKILFPK